MKDLEQGLFVTMSVCARMEVKREAHQQISSTSQVIWSKPWLMLKIKGLINKTQFLWCCQTTETRGVLYGDNCPRIKFKIHLEPSRLKAPVNYNWLL